MKLSTVPITAHRSLRRRGPGILFFYLVHKKTPQFGAFDSECFQDNFVDIMYSCVYIKKKKKSLNCHTCFLFVFWSQEYNLSEQMRYQYLQTSTFFFFFLGQHVNLPNVDILMSQNRYLE